MDKDHRDFLGVIGLQEEQPGRSAHILTSHHIDETNPNFVDSPIRSFAGGVISGQRKTFSLHFDMVDLGRIQ